MEEGVLNIEANQATIHMLLDLGFNLSQVEEILNQRDAGKTNIQIKSKPSDTNFMGYAAPFDERSFKNYGSNEENPETVDSERGRANGGRIGFQDGKTLDFEVYKFYFMNALGMDEEEAEKATEQELYGPDSARLRDSKKGIGSMMASMDDDSEPNAEIIEPSFDSGGEEELMREIETQGGLRTASTQDEMADAYALYDSAVEAGFKGSFEEFIQLMMIEANRGQSIKGAEGLASLRA
jgi:DNA-binding transcriptional MerR regulator